MASFASVQQMEVDAMGGWICLTWTAIESDEICEIDRHTSGLFSMADVSRHVVQSEFCLYWLAS